MFDVDLLVIAVFFILKLDMHLPWLQLKCDCIYVPSAVFVYRECFFLVQDTNSRFVCLKKKSEKKKKKQTKREKKHTLEIPCLAMTMHQECAIRCRCRSLHGRSTNFLYYIICRNVAIVLNDFSTSSFYVRESLSFSLFCINIYI